MCITFLEAIAEKEKFFYHVYSFAFSDNNEAAQSGQLTIGGDASHNNPIAPGEFCFDITAESDNIKESVEIFRLSLTTNDSSVFLTQNLALAKVQANGGIMIIVHFCYVA